MNGCCYPFLCNLTLWLIFFLLLLIEGYGETTFVRQDGEVVSKEMAMEFMVTAANIEESAMKEIKSYPHSVGHYFCEK